MFLHHQFFTPDDDDDAVVATAQSDEIPVISPHAPSDGPVCDDDLGCEI